MKHARAKSAPAAADVPVAAAETAAVAAVAASIVDAARDRAGKLRVRSFISHLGS
jgi:hypothetical protein